MKQKNETKLNNFLRKNKTIFMFTFLLVFLGGLAIATTISDTGITTPMGTYTNLTADNVTAGNLNFGDTNGTFNETFPERPFVSNAPITITVDESGGADYLTIQEAVNQVPYMLRHKYIISIADGTYDEDVYVAPIVVSGIFTDEGSVMMLQIEGASKNATLVKSFHITSVTGTWGLNLNTMNIYGKEPTSDENVSIAIYGSNSVLVNNINFTNATRYGLMAYGSNVYIHSSNFSGQDNAILSKRGSIVNFGDSTHTNSGTTTVAVIEVGDGSFAFSRNNSVTAPNLFVTGGIGMDIENKTMYGLDGMNSNMDVEGTIDSGKNGGTSGRLQLNPSDAGNPVVQFDAYDGTQANISMFSGSDRIIRFTNPGSGGLNVKIDDNLTIGSKIIFTLGEIIDNIVDGWIRVIGSLDVQGDLNVTGNLDLNGAITSDVKVEAGSIWIDSPSDAIFYLDRSVAGKTGSIIFRTNDVPEWYMGSPDADDYSGDGSDFYIGTSEDSPILLIDTEGNINVGNGTNQANITMTSPDGTEYSCGVANGGAFTCV